MTRDISYQTYPYAESQVETLDVHLTSEDQQWLDSFGVDSSWQDNLGLRQELNNLITEGSKRLDEPENQGMFQSVINSRLKFLTFAGITEDIQKQIAVNNPTMIPLNTFISTQRVLVKNNINNQKVAKTIPTILGYAPETVQAKVDNLTDLGIDTSKVINTFPTILGYAPETVQAKVDNLTDLGIDAVKVINVSPAILGYAPETVQAKVDNLTDLGIDTSKVINTFPTILGYAPETVQSKVDNLTDLGIDAVKVINVSPAILGYAPETVQAKVDNLTDLGIDTSKVINTFPTILGYAPETVQAKVDNLTDLGIDAVKVINVSPAILGYAPETVQAKVDNLTDLGIDAVKVINVSPAILGYAPETVRKKVKILERSIELLNWDYTAQDLITTSPTILGFSSKKLAILRRIATTHINEDGRTLEPKKLKTALITPLEQYIIALDQMDDNDEDSYSIQEVIKKARSIKLSASDRRDQALNIAQNKETSNLGRTGDMYLDYRGKLRQ